MAECRLIDRWIQARTDLGVDVVGPLDVVVSSELTIHADMLVRGFGCQNGMIVVTDWARIRHHAEDIIAAGYGYSTFSPPSGVDAYCRGSVIDVLSDWGWSGPPELKPGWLLDPPTEHD